MLIYFFERGIGYTVAGNVQDVLVLFERAKELFEEGLLRIGQREIQRVVDLTRQRGAVDSTRYELVD